MTPFFKKLNLREGQEILLINAPASFGAEATAISGTHALLLETAGNKTHSFALVFVTRQAKVDHWTAVLDEQMPDDAILWFAYPKGSSKNYRCDFNRDTGWQVLGDHGWEGVRLVSIDEDWSALRFRRVQYIKELTRKNKPLQQSTASIKPLQ